MFNQFNQRRPFTPSTPSRPASNQPTPTPAGRQSSFGAQITPDFMKPASSTNSSQGSTRMNRIQPDAYGQMAPQSQRAALYDQARQQTKQAYQANYERMRNPSGALPGGLSEKQRMDFQMLQRTNPAAAQQQLLKYQRTADIRYNKPVSGPSTTPPAGPTNRSNPTNFNGPRPRFGA